MFFTLAFVRRVLIVLLAKYILASLSSITFVLSLTDIYDLKFTVTRMYVTTSKLQRRLLIVSDKEWIFKLWTKLKSDHAYLSDQKH